MNNRLFKKVMAACAVGAIAGALVLIPAYSWRCHFSDRLFSRRL